MTAAVVAPTTDEPDWAIAWRLIRQRDVGDRAPTRAECVLAVWLMLDQGEEFAEVALRMADHLKPSQVSTISAIRSRALRGGDPVKDLRLRNALRSAPTAKQRMLLVTPGITRPGSALELEDELAQLFDELE